MNFNGYFQHQMKTLRSDAPQRSCLPTLSFSSPIEQSIREEFDQSIGVTFEALGPFASCVTSNSTF